VVDVATPLAGATARSRPGGLSAIGASDSTTLSLSPLSLPTVGPMLRAIGIAPLCRRAGGAPIDGAGLVPAHFCAQRAMPCRWGLRLATRTSSKAAFFRLEIASAPTRRRPLLCLRPAGAVLVVSVVQSDTTRLLSFYICLRGGH
jgi:hypothetical protein